MTTNFSDDWINEVGNRLRQSEARADREAYRQYQTLIDGLRFALAGELRLLAPDAEVGSRTKRLETVIAKLQRRPELSLA